MSDFAKQLARQIADTGYTDDGDGGQFIVESKVEAIIDAALAEREAQVRAEEREAARGFVKALERWAVIANLSEQPPHKAYPDAVQQIKMVKEHLTHTLALLATYNDNRKG